MIIRKAEFNDLEKIMEIFNEARIFMAEAGNPTQWKTAHPPRSLIEDDIKNGLSYVCEKDGEILATFYFNIAPDPTYDKIDGAWLNNETYGVIHRIARSHSSKNAKGTGAFCINWCYNQINNIRIDTHKNNGPMIKLLENLGFSLCGTIWLENGDERISFQKV